MSMKKTDLAKNMAAKIDGKMRGAGAPGRFAQGAAEPVDKRERRRQDAAAGLVPFACKLPAELVARLAERSSTHALGVNGLVADLLRDGLA
jgi:hypothetical protein